MTVLDSLQQLLFEGVILPLMLVLGLDAQLEDGYVGAWWLLAGLAQLAVIVVVLLPLQRLRPAEAVPLADEPVARSHRRRAIRADMVYTIIHRLGLFRAVLFITVEPWWNLVLGWARTQGFPTWHLDGFWPGVSDQPWVSFFLYLVVFDAMAWGLHALQHRWGWWWQLHALHHSQRHMTAWSDNRNHLLDDLLHDSVFVVMGLLLGVAPAQFVAVVAVMQLLESLSHANVRGDFGWVGRWLLVSPAFHRRHHAVESPQEWSTIHRGVNYGVLFPWWDRLFATADFQPGVRPTGLLDQEPAYGGRHYGEGFWAQQALGLQRLWQWWRRA